jgi:hypothetical protein
MPTGDGATTVVIATPEGAVGLVGRGVELASGCLLSVGGWLRCVALDVSPVKSGLVVLPGLPGNGVPVASDSCCRKFTNSSEND